MASSRSSNGFVVRRVRADEWQQVKALRLEALQDAAAPIAFLETYDGASAEPGEFWQGRALRSSEGEKVAQYVAIDAESGHWLGTATGLREEPGTDDFDGRPIERLQVHVVGVWVHPAHRGVGVLEAVLAGVSGWASAQGIERLRLYVHADNLRARATYRRCGFTETGRSFTATIGEEIEMIRAGD